MVYDKEDDEVSRKALRKLDFLNRDTVTKIKAPKQIGEPIGPRKQVRLAETTLLLTEVGLSRKDAQKILSYGYKPRDISRFIDRNRSIKLSNRVRAFNNYQIGRALKTEIELMDHLKNKLCGRSTVEARNVLRKSNFNTVQAISTKMFNKKVEEWERRNPGKYFDLKTTKLLKFYEDALSFSKDLKKSKLEKNLGNKTDTRLLKGISSERRERRQMSLKRLIAPEMARLKQQQLKEMKLRKLGKERMR